MRTTMDVGRVYYSAVLGGLGGLFGWLLFGMLGNPLQEHWLQQTVLGGALIGGAIGFLLVGSVALQDQSPLRFFRQSSFGVLLGALGGAVGLIAGELLLNRLTAKFGAIKPGTLTPVLGAVLARGLGWSLLGAAIGVSEGLAARSLRRLGYAMIGGMLGGLAGGMMFGLAVELARGRGPHHPLWSAVSLVILGAAIGALSALVQAVLQPATVRILRGWQEGREYALTRRDNTLGRDEHADIALFRDTKVERRHAIIRRDGQRFILINCGANPELTRLNGRPVADAHDMRDGDRIELGGIALRLHLKSSRPRPALPKTGEGRP